MEKISLTAYLKVGRHIWRSVSTFKVAIQYWKRTTRSEACSHCSDERLPKLRYSGGVVGWQCNNNDDGEGDNKERQTWEWLSKSHAWLSIILLTQFFLIIFGFYSSLPSKRSSSIHYTALISKNPLFKNVFKLDLVMWLGRLYTTAAAIIINLSDGRVARCHSARDTLQWHSGGALSFIYSISSSSSSTSTTGGRQSQYKFEKDKNLP